MALSDMILCNVKKEMLSQEKFINLFEEFISYRNKFFNKIKFKLKEPQDSIRERHEIEIHGLVN